MSSSNKPVYAVVVIVIIAIGAIGGLYVMGVFTPPELPENPYAVAIVFATGGLGDKSFNDAAFKGATDAKNEFGINFTYVEPTEITQYEDYLRTYAQHQEYRDPYKLIIGIGFDQADAMMTVANETPDQRFAIVDMFIDPTVYPNISSIVFNENEGSALVGAIAGLMTDTGKIGFVGGMDIDLINKFAGGYVFGANYSWTAETGRNETTPLQWDVQYVGGWSDTATGQSLADAMYTAGTDVIFAAAGRSGLGVFTSCKNKNGTGGQTDWVIGTDSPQMYLGCADPNNPAPPTVCLTSMLKRVDIAVYRAIRSIVDNSFTGGLSVYSLANGGLGFEQNTALLTLPASVVAFTTQLQFDIVAGNIVVPSTKYWM